MAYLILYFSSTVKPPIKDPSNKGQLPNNGHLSRDQCYGCSVLASEQMTTLV